jgi:hypothetical protein
VPGDVSNGKANVCLSVKVFFFRRADLTAVMKRVATAAHRTGAVITWTYTTFNLNFKKLRILSTECVIPLNNINRLVLVMEA